MPIVAETELIPNRGNCALDSRAQISDGSGSRFLNMRGKICAARSTRYHDRKSSSGSELGWFQTVPLRARNRTNSLTDKDYFSHSVSLRATPAEPLCWYRCWYGAGWSRNGLPVPTAPPDGIRSPPDRMRIYVTGANFRASGGVKGSKI
jgi:hypothetical protein